MGVYNESTKLPTTSMRVLSAHSAGDAKRASCFVQAAILPAETETLCDLAFAGCMQAEALEGHSPSKPFARGGRLGPRGDYLNCGPKREFVGKAQASLWQCVSPNFLNMRLLTGA
jgi:hypothetical protein